MSKSVLEFLGEGDAGERIVHPLAHFHSPGAQLAFWCFSKYYDALRYVHLPSGSIRAKQLTDSWSDTSTSYS